MHRETSGGAMTLDEVIRHYHGREIASGLEGVDAASEEFWIWLNTDGLRKYPDLLPRLGPFPGEDLRVLVSGMKDVEEFARSGAGIYSVITDVLRDRGLSWSKGGRVLDFACGCGRVARMLKRHSGEIEFVGSDLNAEHIRWLKRHLGFGEFTVNRPHPPTSHPDGSFDFIYSISLFSHLDERNQVLWLKELRRLCRPEGLLLLSTHGMHAHAILEERDDLRNRMGITRNQLRIAGERLKRVGFSFTAQENSYLGRNSYGMSFITPEFVGREWTRLFHVIEVREGVIDDWQDAVVLTPKQ